VHALQQVMKEDRMRLPRVRTPKQDNVRLFNLTIRAGAAARPKYRRQTDDARGVSSTVAAIYIVAADHRPHELLRNIVEFVGGFRATEHAERVRPVFFFLGTEAFSYPVQSLIQSGGMVRSIFTDKRLR
jgi:hypothetical protein